MRKNLYMSSPYEDIPPQNSEDNPPPKLTSQSPTPIKVWISVILCLCLFSVGYRLTVYKGLEQTAIMFIALPTFLAIMLSMTPSAKSITGRIMKGMTMAFLLLGILLIEGIICIAMAAPLFYLIGAIIGWVADGMRNENKNKNLYCFALLALVVTSLEGITESLSFDREETVTVTQVVELSPVEALEYLEAGTSFELDKLPGFLQLGFPTPRSMGGKGLAVGNQRVIHFAGGEGEPGDLTVEVTKSSSHSLTLTVVEDTSHIAHWMTWKSVTWELKELPNRGTEVSMIMNYTRELDPAWYFKPIERYGVKKAGEYFIEQTFSKNE